MSEMGRRLRSTCRLSWSYDGFYCLSSIHAVLISPVSLDMPKAPELTHTSPVLCLNLSFLSCKSLLEVHALNFYCDVMYPKKFWWFFSVPPTKLLENNSTERNPFEESGSFSACQKLPLFLIVIISPTYAQLVPISYTTRLHVST